LSGLEAWPPNVRPGELAVTFWGTGAEEGAFCGAEEPSGRPGEEKLSGWLEDLEQRLPIFGVPHSAVVACCGDAMACCGGMARRGEVGWLTTTTTTGVRPGMRSLLGFAWRGVARRSWGLKLVGVFAPP
jgi:hypothetical protein